MVDRRFRIEEGEKAAKVSLTIDGLLSLLKITVGVFSGVAMLTADGLHGVADSTTSIATWLGLFLSKRKPTGRFPYGYYKAENLASLLVSALILYTAYEVLLEGSTVKEVLDRFTDRRLTALKVPTREVT